MESHEEQINAAPLPHLVGKPPLSDAQKARRNKALVKIAVMGLGCLVAMMCLFVAFGGHPLGQGIIVIVSVVGIVRLIQALRS